MPGRKRLKPMSFDESSKALKNLLKNVDWDKEKERRSLLRELDPLIVSWKCELPNLRDFVQPKEIERLLFDCAKGSAKTCYRTAKSRFVRFVAQTGYKDEPDVNERAEPSSRRTTPVHRADRSDVALDLFEIYDRFDVNYTDEDGSTHFHVACQFELVDVVRKFFALGQVDPNLLVTETGDSPLHVALKHNYRPQVAELLLRRGANPNLANRDGSTSWHIMCERTFYSISHQVAALIVTISDETGQSVLVNAQDKLGNAPLHFASTGDSGRMFELLLTRGADPNLANEEGHTALHLMCKSRNCEKLAEIYFRINDEKHQLVRVDARDKLGRTPLKWAVMHVWPNLVDLFLTRGADLSSFVFPTVSEFEEGYMEPHIIDSYYYKFVCGTLCIVESLEKRGYELDRSDALVIMKVLGTYLFDIEDLDECWYHEYEDDLKTVELKPSLSIYDLIRLEPKEAAKLFSYSDYFKLWRSPLFGKRSYKFVLIFFANHLCAKVSREFFIGWALEPFWELTHGRLPLDCCEMIVRKLSNKDLLNVCLAATGQSHKESENKKAKRKIDAKCDNKKKRKMRKSK